MQRKTSTSDVRERILEVARELFIEKGYMGTSIRDIAAASGANVAHVNYYFNSKSQLFEIIFDDVFDTIVKRVFSLLDSDMPFLQMVEEWINVYYEVLPQFPQVPIFLLNEINHSPETIVDKILKKNPLKIFDRLSQRIEEEVAKGSIKKIPAIDLGLNILSLCIFPFVFTNFVVKITDNSMADYHALIKEHKKYVIDMVLSGLKP